MRLPFAAVFWVCGLAVWLSARGAELQVFAATSLTDALQDVAKDFQAETGTLIRFNFAGSPVLSRQIQEGAPADVFVSADNAKMDDVERGGLLLPGSRVPILSNALVVIVPSDSTLKIQSPSDLLSPAVGRLALADPAGVPAGVYAKAYFERHHLWDAVKGRVIPTENVRAAATAVAMGNAGAGIVYKTDAQANRAIRVAYEIPPAECPPIFYPAAILKDTRHGPEAARFLKYLQSESARARFTEHGFLVPAP